MSVSWWTRGRGHATIGFIGPCQRVEAAMTTVFTSEQCDVLQQALDIAWEMFLRAHKPGAEEAEAIKGALTRAILDEYEHGEHNARRMAIAAVAHIEQFEAPAVSGRMQKPVV